MLNDDIEDDYMVSPYFFDYGGEWRFDIDEAKEYGLCFNDQGRALIYNATQPMFKMNPKNKSTFLWSVAACATYFSYFIVPTGIPYVDLNTSAAVLALLSLH